MSNPPDYPYDALEYGDTLEVAPGVHWVRMPLPFQLNHINLWLLQDGDGWTIVDTGYFTDETRDHWRAILDRLRVGKPITRTIVTHFHPDHLGLAGWFEAEYGARMWMSQAEYLQAHLAWTQGATHDVDGWMDFFVRNGLDPAVPGRFKAARPDFGRGVTKIPITVKHIRDGDIIEIGGRDWRAITSGGHSPEHVSLFCESLNLLISGDQVLPRITTNISVWYTEPDGDPLRHFLTSFDNFRPLPEDVLVLPSHDRPFRGLHDRLDGLIEHHNDRLDATAEHCETPRTAADLLPVLFKRELDDHQITFAMGEALAHLNFLVADGRLRNFRNDAGYIVFQRR
jgi:glyoxylase-like metal-dependent hydrolase (beta-lactamase superfamily II)